VRNSHGSRHVQIPVALAFIVASFGLKR